MNDLEEFYQNDPQSRVCKICSLPVELQEKIEGSWDNINHSGVVVVRYLASQGHNGIPKHQPHEHMTGQHWKRRQ